jgi:hypothetical protein
MSRSGLILIALGVLLLAQNLGWLTWAWLVTWWPLGLVALGLWSLWEHRRDAQGLTQSARSARPEDPA